MQTGLSIGMSNNEGDSFAYLCVYMPKMTLLVLKKALCHVFLSGGDDCREGNELLLSLPAEN